jgi:DDE family transposase
VRKSISPYPVLAVGGDGSGVVSQAGAVLLLRTAERLGLTSGLPEALAPWRKPMSTHDPGKIVLDLAVSLAIGGDCVSDLASLRAEPGVFGRVASDPTVSRLVAVLAADAPKALSAITSARADARARAWALAGPHAPDHGIDEEQPLLIDLDATLTDAHSEKEKAAPTFKRGFGFQCAVRRWCAVRRQESKEVRDLLAGCRSSPVGAKRSLTRETPERVGSSAAVAGTVRNCRTGRVRRARSDGIRQEPAVKLRKRGTGSNLADMGRDAVHGNLIQVVDSEAG